MSPSWTWQSVCDSAAAVFPRTLPGIQPETRHSSTSAIGLTVPLLFLRPWSGIIAARNNGAGIFGVVPDMPILAIKVLGKDGSGPLDNVYSAYKEVLARLKKVSCLLKSSLVKSSLVKRSSLKRSLPEPTTSTLTCSHPA